MFCIFASLDKDGEIEGFSLSQFQAKEHKQIRDEV